MSPRRWGGASRLHLSTLGGDALDILEQAVHRNPTGPANFTLRSSLRRSRSYTDLTLAARGRPERPAAAREQASRGQVPWQPCPEGPSAASADGRKEAGARV